MTNDTSLESSYAKFLKSAKKIANLQNFNFLLQNKMLKNKDLVLYQKK